MPPPRVSPEYKVKIGFTIRGVKFPLHLATELSLEVSSVMLNAKLTHKCAEVTVLEHLEKNEIIKENNDHKSMNTLFVKDK